MPDPVASTTLLAIAIGVAVALAGLVWMVRRERRSARERSRLLSSMGFQPVAQPDAQLTRTLLPLVQPGRGRVPPDRIRLRNVFRCDSSEGQLYLFDAFITGRRSAQIASGAVGVVRPGASLPVFELCPFTEGGGFVSGMMLRLFRAGFGDGQVVRFDDVPEFGRRFTVLARGAGGVEEVRRYLAPRVRERLVGFEFLVLAAGGDAFVVHPKPQRAPRGRRPADLLRKLVDDAIQLSGVLGPGLLETRPAGPRRHTATGEP